MDPYVDLFQSHGGSMVMLAKGNRSRQVREACGRHGGFYLGSIGGPAARLADHSIKKVDVHEYPELGMEAIWRIEIEDFPAFIVIDEGERLLRRADGEEAGRVRAAVDGHGNRADSRNRRAATSRRRPLSRTTCQESGGLPAHPPLVGPVKRPCNRCRQEY